MQRLIFDSLCPVLNCLCPQPLKNYDAVLSAIRGMTDGSRFGLAPSRITLSTVGVVPNMLQLTRDMPSIQLALSLHAPTQELRQRIVPTAKSWPLDKLIEAMDYFILRSRKRILVEYVMLEGVNDAIEHAHQLGQLLKGKEVVSGGKQNAAGGRHQQLRRRARVVLL